MTSKTKSKQQTSWPPAWVRSHFDLPDSGSPFRASLEMTQNVVAGNAGAPKLEPLPDGPELGRLRHVAELEPEHVCRLLGVERTVLTSIEAGERVFTSDQLPMEVDGLEGVKRLYGAIATWECSQNSRNGEKQ